MDLACTVLLGALLTLAAAVYGVRVATRGRTPHARVEAEGESALVPKSAMEGLYWFAEPIVTLCVKAGVTANAVTYSSLVLGVAAGVSFATGHFGIGALVASLGGAGDALDGLLARRLRVASPAGEVLDAAIDRYVDFALLGGLALYFNGEPAPLAFALLALLAAFMVSYSSAKSDALGVVPPRGSMRRAERVVLIIAATALGPAVAAFDARYRDVPVVVALGAIALFGNASAIRRMMSIRDGVRDVPPGSQSRPRTRPRPPVTRTERLAE